MSIISRISKITARFFDKNRLLAAGLFIVCIAILLSIASASAAPGAFPPNAIVKIKKNSGLSQVAQTLAEKGIIRSPLMFKAYVVLLGGSKTIQAGDYAFPEPQSSLRIAYRAVKGIQELQKIKVVLPEGLTAKEMSAILARNIPEFDAKAFVTLAQPYEGYLFPDTYFFYQDVEPAEVIATMRDEFSVKTEPLAWQVKFSGHPLSDVVTMASIVQKESYDETEQKLIAGVLWRRIGIGMALQVDPTLAYILRKGGNQLTLKDLATTSAYNTYTHKGLPPGPIGNPGLDAITATLNPTESKYLFYLSDVNGVMHFAATNDQHVANIRKYIP